MKTEKEFRQYYDEYMISDIESLEAKRDEAYKKRRIFSIIAIPIGIVLILIMFSIFPILGFAIGIFYFIIFSIILHNLSKDYKADFKRILIAKIIQFFSPKLMYFPNDGISLNEYLESRLFTGGNDRFNGEDLITGKIYFKDSMEDNAEGVSFKMSELHAEERHTDSKGKTHYSTVFKGVFMILEFNKSFKSDTYVFNDSGIFNRLGGRFGTKQVKLEDPVFEKEFEVYSNDQMEARYILTPDFMDKLVELKIKAQGKMRVAFKNNKMYLAISSSGNILEPNYSKNLDDYNNIITYFRELEYYFELIKSLNLDQKIYL